MLQHVNDSKYGDVVKMIPVKQIAPKLPQPKPLKRVFKDRATSNLPIINGIQPGNYHQPTKPVVTKIPVDNYVNSTMVTAAPVHESTVNNVIDFTTPSA